MKTNRIEKTPCKIVPHPEGGWAIHVQGDKDTVGKYATHADAMRAAYRDGTLRIVEQFTDEAEPEIHARKCLAAFSDLCAGLGISCTSQPHAAWRSSGPTARPQYQPGATPQGIPPKYKTEG